MSEKRQPFWKRCELTPRDRRNQQWALIWLFSWSLAWVAASLALKEGWVAAGVPSVAVAVLPTILGVGMMIAYWKFVRQADELQRKIQLDALALGFGTGVVGAVAYQLLERADVISKVDVTDMSSIMMFAFAIGILVGARRYA